MKPFLPVHDRYLARTALIAVGMAWMVLLGFDLIVALVGELDDIGKGQFGFFDAVINTLLSAPRRAYELYPTAAVIGCLLGLGGLAAGSELVALRAAGLSKMRIATSVLVLVALLTGVMVVVGETIGPAG
ncbi:MAG: LPS export ABC transporter permease LptG, partial [Gammaproteobacteria bacterium HGW-Gammaproteobacteria-7]